MLSRSPVIVWNWSPSFWFQFLTNWNEEHLLLHTVAEVSVNIVKSWYTSPSQTNVDTNLIKPENAFLIFLQTGILATAGKVAAVSKGRPVEWL